MNSLINNPTIFVSISCMDDDEIEYTVKSIFENADFPSYVYVGVGLTAKNNKYLKLIKKMSKENPNIRYSFTKQKRNNLETLGVGKGRLKAESLYREEDYFMQVDSHSYFNKSWDSIVLSLFEEAVKKVGDSKVVLTCIPPRYVYDKKEKPKKIEPFTRYPTFVPGFFVGVVPKWGEEDSLKFSLERIIPSPKANSAFMFGKSEFAKNTGIAPDSIFYDEEIIYSINLFGLGYALAFPNVKEFPIMHLDGDAMIKGHERSFFLDYLDRKHSDLIHERLQNHYSNFILDSKNQESIKKYKKYAKVDLQRGYFSSQPFSIPTSFR